MSEEKVIDAEVTPVEPTKFEALAETFEATAESLKFKADLVNTKLNVAGNCMYVYKTLLDREATLDEKGLAALGAAELLVDYFVGIAVEADKDLSV